MVLLQSGSTAGVCLSYFKRWVRLLVLVSWASLAKMGRPRAYLPIPLTLSHSHHHHHTSPLDGTHEFHILSGIIKEESNGGFSKRADTNPPPKYTNEQLNVARTKFYHLLAMELKSPILLDHLPFYCTQ